MRPLKEKQEYLDIAESKFDIDLFYEYLEADREDPKHRDHFFEKIWRERREFYQKDLVLDLSESWKQWFKRNGEFGDPPLIPRDECPENLLPHRSFYGKIASWSNGRDPYPPRRRRD